MITIMIDTTAASAAEIQAFEKLNGYQQFLGAVKGAKDGLPISITIGLPLPDGGVYWSKVEPTSFSSGVTSRQPKPRPQLKLVSTREST